MKNIFSFLGVVCLATVAAFPSLALNSKKERKSLQMKTLSDFTVKNASGEDYALKTLQGKVVLIVNVASKCGFTPQYAGLEKLFEKFSSKGLVILGFPCNQFGAQEPDTEAEIVKFCSLNYNVTFPIMAKIDVNGSAASPIYEWLKASAPGILGSEAIKWNFTKFLVGRDGKVVDRFAPQTKPEELEGKIEKLLN